MIDLRLICCLGIFDFWWYLYWWFTLVWGFVNCIDGVCLLVGCLIVGECLFICWDTWFSYVG